MPSLHRFARLLLTVAALAMGPCLSAQTGLRLPLTPSAVALAITATGMQTDAAQVELPVGLSVVGSEARLRVTAAELRPDGRIRVRLTCQQPQICQPFLATVVPVSAGQALVDFDALRLRLGGEASAAGGAPGTRLRAGQRVMLLLENAHMRITLPVLAIDSGAPGTAVRVSSLDRKQIYNGTVLDAGTIRGALP